MRSLAISATVAVVASAFSGALPAAASERFIGSWIVSADKDPFSDNTNVIAFTLSTNRLYALALRCLNGEPSAVIKLPDDKADYISGQDIEFKFRADDDNIITGTAKPFSDNLIEFPDIKYIISGAEKAKQIAFQLELPNGAAGTVIFRPKNSKKALEDVRSACGIWSSGAK